MAHHTTRLTDAQEVIALVNSHLPKEDEVNIIPVVKLEWIIVNDDSQFYIGYDDSGPCWGHIVDAHSFLLLDDAQEELNHIIELFGSVKAFAIGVRDDDVCQVQMSF